ncbi:hypothetical protein Tco_0656668 [Tanacetum coccineum]|uniref:Uncharacterized protein n=1 Tax=Tanacetum coccineum TaxID=301880 RepID=A0ABQ4X9E8_9ASTR
MRSLQMDIDDEISNLVDLYMGMFGGGWKWQDLQGLDIEIRMRGVGPYPFYVALFTTKDCWAGCSYSLGESLISLVLRVPYMIYYLVPCLDISVSRDLQKQVLLSSLYDDLRRASFSPPLEEDHAPEYPKYLAPSDVEVPLEDQPLPVDASPTALSPGYAADFDLDEDPEEDPEEDHTDYLADGGDGDDEPSDDDDDDDDDTDDEDEEPFEDEDDDDGEEEEHLAPANYSAIPIVDPVPSAGDTEAFETDESAPTPRSPQTKVPFAQTRLRRARKTVRLEPPMSASMEARIAEHAAAPTPPLPVASPPLPLPSPLTTSPTDAGAPLGYRAAGIRMRAASPPLLLPSTSHRTDIPEAEMPPRKRACFTTPAPGLEVGESSAAGAARQPGPTLEADLRRDRVMETGYGITDTWDEIVEAMLEVAPTTLEGVNQRVTELATTVRQETEEFQVRFEDAQDDRAYLRARVNTLFRDRPYHRHTAMILDREAMYARMAWTGSEDRSAAIEAHVRTLEAQVATLIAQTLSLQTQLTTALGRIETLEARDPEPQDEPAEAGSSC